MVEILLSVLGILVTIFFVVGTHEAAHFMVARMLSVKVLRFSIGFGKGIYRWVDKRGTEYVIAWIPLGGYVKMLDESEEPVPSNERHLAYNNQPYYKKFLIVLAGPAMNLLCAVVLYWLIFTIGFTTVKPIIGTVTPNSIASKAGLKPNQEITAIDHQQTNTWTAILFRLLAHTGENVKVTLQTQYQQKQQQHLLDLATWKMDALQPDPFASLGFTPFEPPLSLIIGHLKPDSPAHTAGLKVGDVLIQLNNQPIKSWEEVISAIQAKPGEVVHFTIQRNGKTQVIPVTIGTKRSIFLNKRGFLGMGPDFSWPKEMLHKIQYSPLDAIPRACQEVANFTYLNLQLFGKLFTGKLSLQSLGGPITIFESAGNALNAGFIGFLSFLAFLSISIGIVNILPIPGLDGGHLFFQTIEAIIRRPIPDRILNFLFRVGFIFLFLILIQALVNDVLRL